MFRVFAAHTRTQSVTMCDGCTHMSSVTVVPLELVADCCSSSSMNLSCRVCVCLLHVPQKYQAVKASTCKQPPPELSTHCTVCPACGVSCCVVLTSDSSLPAYSDIQTALKAPESYHPVIQHSWTVSSNIRTAVTVAAGTSLCTFVRCVGVQGGGWAVVGRKGSASPAPMVLC